MRTSRPNRASLLGTAGIVAVGITSCISLRGPGQSDDSFDESRARSACVDEAGRVGFDEVEVVSDRDGGRAASGFGPTILVRLRVNRANAPDGTAEIDEVLCSYDRSTRRPSILT